MGKGVVGNCPHCGQSLKKWLCPPETDWDVEYMFVCFNDECPYFIQGWEWMKNKFNQHVSYRYMFNPFNKTSGPLPVWSKDAMRNFITD